MENNLPAEHPGPRNDAALLLGSLNADRADLAKRLREPKWFAPGLGAIAAIFISSPAWAESFNRGFVLTSLVTLSIFIVLGYQRVTGVKLLGFRFREGALFAVAIVATLFLYSVSLGLAASGFRWWIMAPVIVGFLAATSLARLVASSMRGRVSHVA
ncbi:hypothetical protein CQ018_08525 [Arthrobacter sp. MYb227]|uniref:hypothetical protein n=1 Tax=Arthrobacter sp. MYb227 TaxID=1848601 RepID=UPI000CFC69D0|nr:hypothetical protein [Arthrobacter sp. MYb227]PQZ93693.1 hypothetical protein CQ018_08525 [Arthrobacter sp. MYb227]